MAVVFFLDSGCCRSVSISRCLFCCMTTAMLWGKDILAMLFEDLLREHVLHQLWKHYYKCKTIFCSWTLGLVRLLGLLLYICWGYILIFSCRYPFPSWTVRSLLLKTQLEEEMTPMLALAWIMVLLHLWVGLSLYLIPKPETWNGHHESCRAPKDYCLLKGEHQWAYIYPPEVKPLGFPHGWKHPVHPDTHTLIGCTTGGGVHRKSCARMVTYPSTLPVLGGSISEFLWDPGWSHP